VAQPKSRTYGAADAPLAPAAERVMAVAAEMFRERGYAGTTTRELANALAIRNASLYHHIGSKEDLLYRLCVHALSSIESTVSAAIENAGTPVQRLESLVNAHVVNALANQDEHATMLIELRALSPARHAEVLHLRDQYEGLVRRTVADAQQAGMLRADVSAKHLTLSLLNLLNWSIFWFRPTGELTPEGVAALLWTVFFGGAGYKQPSSIA
jgi:AcrR family transcriptional regulator